MQASSFDEVASAAASGSAPVVIVVCPDIATIEQLTEWLATAVPAFGAFQVLSIASDELSGMETTPVPTVLVVADASSGDDEALHARWSAWNLARDRLLSLVDYGRAGSLVLPVTTTRMRDVSAASIHLLSVATVLTVVEDGSKGEADEDLRAVYAAALRALEARYGISTKEVIERLLERRPLPVTGHDLARWQAAAEALRAADG